MFKGATVGSDIFLGTLGAEASTGQLELLLPELAVGGLIFGIKKGVEHHREKKQNKKDQEEAKHANDEEVIRQKNEQEALERQQAQEEAQRQRDLEEQKRQEIIRAQEEARQKSISDANSKQQELNNQRVEENARDIQRAEQNALGEANLMSRQRSQRISALELQGMPQNQVDRLRGRPVSIYADYYNPNYPFNVLFHEPENEQWQYISGSTIQDRDYPAYSGQTKFTREEAERLGLITAEDVNVYGYPTDFQWPRDKIFIPPEQESWRMISGDYSIGYNQRNDKYIVDKYGNVVRERYPEEEKKQGLNPPDPDPDPDPSGGHGNMPSGGNGGNPNPNDPNGGSNYRPPQNRGNNYNFGSNPYYEILRTISDQIQRQKNKEKQSVEDVQPEEPFKPGDQPEPDPREQKPLGQDPATWSPSPDNPYNPGNPSGQIPGKNGSGTYNPSGKTTQPIITERIGQAGLDNAHIIQQEMEAIIGAQGNQELNAEETLAELDKIRQLIPTLKLQQAQMNPSSVYSSQVKRFM